MTLTAVQVATIAAIGSALVPLVVSFLKREHWSAGVKQLLAFVASVAVAVVGIAVTTPHWVALNTASLVGLAYTGSQLVYQTYFRGSAFDGFLTGLNLFSGTPTSSIGAGVVHVTAPASPQAVAASVGAALAAWDQGANPSAPKVVPSAQAPTGADGRPL